MPKIVDKHSRRRDIVAAATRVFAERGYHLARMDDVAAELGISKGLLYASFATKEDLFMQVCLSLVPWKDLGEGGDDPERRVRALIAAIVARYEEAHNFFLILSDFWTAAMRGPNAKRAALLATGARFYVPVRAALVAAIRDGQRAGAFAADAVVTNVDAAAVAGLVGRRPKPREHSLSGLALLLGLDGRTPDLAHHRIEFPANYDAEFDDVFAHARMPRDPTLYVSAPSATAGGPEAWFVLVNAPAAPAEFDPHALIDRLGVRDRLVECIVRTPQDLERETGAVAGAIYGVAPHGRLGALKRPGNRMRGIDRLWLTGGTVHPGGGLPLVALGGRMVARELTR
jgi:AcrR family transcriptional regulator